MIWCTNNTNAHIPTFCKCWSFIWRCFFPVSILQEKYLRENPQRNFEQLFWKEQDLETSTLNNLLKQCASILKKSKRSYFEILDVKFVNDNEKFWKKISILFSNKIKSKENITVVENDEKFVENDEIFQVIKRSQKLSKISLVLLKI